MWRCKKETKSETKTLRTLQITEDEKNVGVTVEGERGRHGAALTRSWRVSAAGMGREALTGWRGGGKGQKRRGDVPTVREGTHKHPSNNFTISNPPINYRFPFCRAVIISSFKSDHIHLAPLPFTLSILINSTNFLFDHRLSPPRCPYGFSSCNSHSSHK